MKQILFVLAAVSAILSVRGDGLAITPATLPDGMEGVPYSQTLFVEGGDQTSYQWREVHASWTTAACSYQVSANETPLWEGRKSSGNVEYALPFAFPFGGKTYDKVYVGTHGFLFFKNASVDQTYPYNSDLYYYTGVAPFWCDTSNVEGYVDASVANEVSFRFESFSSGTGTWAARVTLKSDGTIRYAYRQDGNTFNSDRTIGVGFSECGDYTYVGDVTDGIPTTDIVFETYGLPDGLQLNENYYQDPDTGVYGSVLSGTLNEACDVKFAVRARTNYVDIATNFYRFSIVRNPNRPPVIDAFSPADTNEVIFLNLGDTATFNVAVTDEAGDPFDVKWEFMRKDGYYVSSETVGTETNLVFEATQALYEMQNPDYQPILRCTVSDECWTNTVIWKVNIRRDWYVDASANPDGADGSTASFSGTFARDGSSYVATGVSITVKGKTMSMGLMCDPQPYAGSDEGFGEIGGGSEDVQDEPCIALNCAWQNIWKRGDLAAEWKPAFAAGTEKTLDLQDTWLADLSVGDSLTYAFGADGAVSITGKIYGESVNATATLDLEGLDGSSGTMHCNFFFLANGHLYQQQFTFPRQATVTATDITLDSFVRID